MMFVLQYKQLHIVQEPKRKNRAHQTHRWKDYAMCEDRKPLDDFIVRQKRPDEWRVEEKPFEAREAQEEDNESY